MATPTPHQNLETVIELQGMLLKIEWQRVLTAIVQIQQNKSVICFQFQKLERTNFHWDQFALDNKKLDNQMSCCKEVVLLGREFVLKMHTLIVQSLGHSFEYHPSHKYLLFS